MKFKELAVYLQKLESTTSRNEITRVLADLFKKSDKEEIDKIVYLVLGTLAPSYKGIILNIAERMMLVIIAYAFNEDPQKVKSLYKQKGDLGNVAESLAKNNNSNLGVIQVYEQLMNIAEEMGSGSQEKKISAMAKLIGNLDPLSVRYVARIPVGKLRLGFSDKTIIDALSVMEAGDKSAKAEIERAYNIRPDIGAIARLVKVEGFRNLTKNLKPEIGVPVSPMLAQRLNSPEEMVKKMGIVSVEPKYDGLRIFIHYKKPDYTRTFTRNLNFIEGSVFPELIDIGKYLNANEVILDTEAVGMDPKRERFLDFQTTMQRRRKHDIEKTTGNIPLQFQVFDILLKDGKNLLHIPYKKRREVLNETVVDGPLLKIDEYTITSDPNQIRKLHQKYVKLGLEGVIVKRADSLYISGRTGWNWVKMKETPGARGKLADTVDGVVMGYSAGRGKRATFGLGQFLVGIKDGEIFKTVTKVGTGLSDEQFKQLNKMLKGLVTDVKPKEYEVHKDLNPDFWVLPKVVVELAADEITKSPKHTAGVALRFPRLIRFRDDKAASDATTTKELISLYKMQKTS